MAAPISILMADDDEDDVLLARLALQQSRLANPLATVRDGVELLRYLRHTDEYQDAVAHPRPGLILLDLNMPRMDGREALMAIKADESLRSIPVVVLTTSSDDTDIERSYDLGANSYIVKPVTFDGLTKIMNDIGRYWLEIVELPGSEVTQ